MTAAISLIIAGSRGLSPTIEEIDYEVRNSRLVVMVGGTVREVVSGAARGVDVCGERWAAARGIAIHREPVTADDYARHDKFGPKVRNARMAERADALLAFWDGRSGATADMVCRMVALGKLVHVVTRGVR